MFSLALFSLFVSTITLKLFNRFSHSTERRHTGHGRNYQILYQILVIIRTTLRYVKFRVGLVMRLGDAVPVHVIDWKDSSLRNDL